jgi:hypothetical protein
MIASQSNLAGVIIKGIDPQTVGKVTELVKNTEAGSLDHLLHPDQMVTLGSTRTLSPASCSPRRWMQVPTVETSPDGGRGKSRRWNSKSRRWIAARFGLADV